MLVHLFTPTGATFTFRDAAIVLDNETMLRIEYTAASDGQFKVATIQKAQIVGWSTTAERATPRVTPRDFPWSPAGPPGASGSSGGLPGSVLPLQGH